jgi:hypothetical protein
MLCGVVLEVIPQMVSKGVFRIGVLFQDALKLGPFGGEDREFEVARLAEANKEDPLAVLWHDTLAVDDFNLDFIFEVLGKRFIDHPESIPLIMALQVLDVFQHESRRAVVGDDIRDGEEQVSLFHIVETMCPTEAVFLGNAGDAEWLAGEAAAEDIVGGDVGDFD